MKQVRIKLDILPYLSLLNTFQNVYKNNTADLEELFLCLSDIDTAISESRSNIISNVVDNYSTPIIIDRIQGHLKCLTTSSLRFKNRVRQYGSDDLEPLIRHINSKLHRYLEGDNGLHNGASSSSSSSITTRNLVDEGPILNNLEQSDATSQLEMEVASSNGSSLIAYVSSNNNLRQDNNPNSSLGGFSFKKSSLGGGMKGFLENTFKDPVGKTLTFVVGTGLSILLLNLIIVAIITLRSSRTRRAAAAAAAQSNASNDFLSISQNGTGDDLNDGFEQTFETLSNNNNSKKSTLKKSRISDIESNKSQPFLNSSFKSNQTTNLRSTKQLKFDLTGVPMRKNFQEDFISSNNDQTSNNKSSQRLSGADQMVQMVEFDHQNNNADQTECYPVKDNEQMMFETMMNNFDDAGILLSISPMLTKCNSSCMNEFLMANDEQQQQQQQELSESELDNLQKLWPNQKVTNCNEYFYQPCRNKDRQDMTTYYGSDSDNHFHPHNHNHHHHNQYNSTNSPITSTQSNSTITTICPTNTTSSFNASSMLVDQKRARDLPACSSSSQHQLNNYPCFHQQANYIQNQSTGSPGSSATLSVTPIPIQLESLALTTQQVSGKHLHQNSHLDSVYQVESQANFVPLPNQTNKQRIDWPGNNSTR